MSSFTCFFFSQLRYPKPWVRVQITTGPPVPLLTLPAWPFWVITEPVMSLWMLGKQRWTELGWAGCVPVTKHHPRSTHVHTPVLCSPYGQHQALDTSPGASVPVHPQEDLPSPPPLTTTQGPRALLSSAPGPLWPSMCLPGKAQTILLWFSLCYPHFKIKYFT